MRMAPARPDRAGGGARTIALGERLIPYVLRRSQRKTIGLRVDGRGVTVGAPHRARLGDIEDLIRKHGDWLIGKLDAWQERAAPERLPITDGMVLPILGREVGLRLAAGRNRAVWSAQGETLTLGLAPGTEPRGLLERALRERARAVFLARIAALAPVLGVPPPPLALSSARTRWGSCSSRGDIRLNWRLLFFPLPLVDYVVAHELAHLREMNHSPRFWSVVESLCPDWRQRRLQLRQLAPRMPLL